MTHKHIFHMCQQSAWQEAQKSGEYRGSALDLKDGFIHFSDPAQVRETAALHQAGVAGLVLLKVPVDRVEDALKWEKARNGSLFPHLYRPLKVADVESVAPLDLDANGLHIFPDPD